MFLFFVLEFIENETLHERPEEHVVNNKLKKMYLRLEVSKI